MYVRYVLLLMGFISFLSVNLANAGNMPRWIEEGGWVPFEEFCRFSNKELETNWDCSSPPTVTNQDYINYWAGEFRDVYWSKAEDNMRVKIRITWVTDRSQYRCGEIIEKRYRELKDFTSRSLMMKRCQ